MDFVFQSTPPHGGRLGPGHGQKSNSAFQSTPPHGGRRICGEYYRVLDEFQSTPPHGGRPTSYNLMYLKYNLITFCEPTVF